MSYPPEPKGRGKSLSAARPVDAGPRAFDLRSALRAGVVTATDVAELLDVTQHLAGVRALDDLTATVRGAARALSGADGVTFVLREGDVVHYADEDAIAPLWKGKRFPAESCISGWAMIHARPAIIEDIFVDPRIPHDAYQPTFVKSLVMMPVGSTPVAAIGAYWATRRRATDREIVLLQALADACAIALVNVQALADAATQQSQLRALLDFMPELGWTAQPDGRVDFYNRGWYAYTGQTPEELRSNSHAVHDPAMLPSVLARWAHSLEHGLPFEMEFKLRRHDGAYRWFLTRVNPVKDENGKVVRWVGINTDIDDRRRADTERAELLLRAEAASRAKDEFLAMLGHELRNPLAPITTAIHLMRLRGDNGAAREHDIIERQVRHVTRLIDDLLDVSRFTRGKIELTKKPVEIAEVVASAIEIAAPLFEQRRHRLEVDVPRHGLTVSGDRTRLAQVLANLLNNAAKYSEPGGHVVVRACAEDGQVRVHVRDHGHGIAADLLPRVFDIFVQGQRDPDRSLGGLGLGLTIVHSLVTLHGGTVSAQSERLGRGSEFCVRLPRLSDEAAIDARTPQAGAASSAERRRILVVDDNEDAALLLMELLRHVGHEVVVASDALHALEASASFHPQIAILDIGLPVMDGYELARRLRATLPAPPHLIALTGYGQPSDRQRAREAGFQEHIVKPVEPDVLLVAVARAASASSAHSPHSPHSTE